VDLLLPWIGVPLAAVGLYLAIRSDAIGWWLLAIGIAMLVLDLVLAFFWAHQPQDSSEQPLLNRRGSQHIGRQVCVIEAITGGEGRVRVADTVWRARGPDCAAGTWVRVLAAESDYLVVASAETPPEATRDEASSS
jgi:membrane protein implicated in regulation of membrane protease activity